MFLELADHGNPRSWASKLRRIRTGWLKEELLSMGVEGPIEVLDVGGTPDFWRMNLPELAPLQIRITLLNRGLSGQPLPEGMEEMAGDARSMPQFADNRFDLCFSNSVIEHVGTLEDQMRMAAEVRRVARHYFIQTPYRYFPLEPHFHMPFWPFWPMACKVWAYRRFRLGWNPPKPDYLAAKAEIESIRLLTIREMSLLFPGSRLRREAIGPFVKSIIVSA